MKRILFIDFDGTLCFDRFWRSAEPEVREKIQTYFKSNTELISDWMRGKYTSEEINARIADELSLQYETLWNIFVSDCNTMRIDPRVLQRIREIRSEYTTVLITDNMDCFSRFTVPSLKLESSFDAIVDSYTEKRLKNDDAGKLFIDTLEKYRTTPSESILLDNSRDTCQIFENLGGIAILITPEQSLSFWLESF